MCTFVHHALYMYIRFTDTVLLCGWGDTYTCVHVATARTRQTGYPRGSSTPTPIRDTDSNTKRRTVCPSECVVSFGTGTSSSEQSLHPSPFSYLSSLRAFLHTTPSPVSPSFSLCLPARANDADMQDHQDALTAGRGYTPIDLEIPSNGQLENRLEFPRSHLPAWPSCPLTPSG